MLQEKKNEATHLAMKEFKIKTNAWFISKYSKKYNAEIIVFSPLGGFINKVFKRRNTIVLSS